MDQIIAWLHQVLDGGEQTVKQLMRLEEYPILNISKAQHVSVNTRLALSQPYSAWIAVWLIFVSSWDPQKLKSPSWEIWFIPRDQKVAKSIGYSKAMGPLNIPAVLSEDEHRK